MIRVTAIVATIAMGVSGANAQTALERGRYLVTTIMACGNCHTPKDANGAPIAERELSGGVAFTVPPSTQLPPTSHPILRLVSAIGVTTTSSAH